MEEGLEQQRNGSRKSPSYALSPLFHRSTADYLLHGQAGASRQRWEQVGAYLTHNPDSC